MMVTKLDTAVTTNRDDLCNLRNNLILYRDAAKEALVAGEYTPVHFLQTFTAIIESDIEDLAAILYPTE